VRFVSVHEYLFLLKFITQELNKCGQKGLIYSAAAVSDFYIPDSEMVRRASCSCDALVRCVVGVERRLT
jgi:hypothetical protein